MTQTNKKRPPLYRPMVFRDPAQVQRGSTPLECLFDLCFVVAVAQAGISLEEQIADHRAGAGILGYGMVFFAIWWAWMNFTWFASAYDTDDIPYRLTVMVQIAGSLVLAAGVSSVFDQTPKFLVVAVGYVIMRLASVTNWVRAARSDPPRRKTALRYVVATTIVQACWLLFQSVPSGSKIVIFFVLVVVEILIPWWAEREMPTTWHPAHIAERYGLFTVIVLGESVTATVVAIKTGLDADSGRATVVGFAVAGIVILFAMWWIYFDHSADDLLTDLSSALRWGYGHYFVFSAAAAVGAGLNIAVENATHAIDVSNKEAGLGVSIPVAIYLMMVWALHVRKLNSPSGARAFPVAAVLVIAVGFTGVAIPLTALICVALVAVMIIGARPDSLRRTTA